MSTEIQTVQPIDQPVVVHAPSNPLDLPSEVFSAGLDRRKANRAALLQWVKDALVENVDYGRIHFVSKDKCKKGKNCTNEYHFSKPSLFKPGAEKICGMLGVTSSFPALREYEGAALSGIAISSIILRCEIFDATGKVVADGIGARQLKQDYGDINKSLKMAEKSAHIDATLRLAGLSEVFTQDIEDMVNVTNAQESTSENTDSLSVATNTAQTTQTPEAIISSKDHRQIEAIINDLGLDRDRIKVWLSKATAHRPGGAIEHLNHLPASMFEAFLDKLDQLSKL